MLTNLEGNVEKYLNKTARFMLSLLMLLAAPCFSDEAPGQPVEVQLAMEKTARELVSTPAVQQQITRSIAFLEDQAKPVRDYDRADLDRYVHELAFCVALAVVNLDPSRPKVVYNGFPGAEYGLVNPDNVYRFIPLSPDSRYQIKGRLKGASHVSFQVTTSSPFVGGALGRITGTLSSEHLQVQDDGSFIVTLGPEPAGDTPNYLQITEGSNQLMIRDSFSDWSKLPMELSVSKLSGPTRPEPTFEELTQKVVQGLAASTKLWFDIPRQYNYHIPANILPPPRATGAGGLQGQYNTGGHFDLQPDQALVITIQKGTASYFGFQLGSTWYVPFDYAEHTSSFSDFQSIPNPDGSYTYVISLQDPGTANWLDPVGHASGLMFLRWQGLTEPLTEKHAPMVQLVKLKDLDSALPEGSPRMSPSERSRIIAQRKAHVEQRRAVLAGSPAH